MYLSHRRKIRVWTWKRLCIWEKIWNL